MKRDDPDVIRNIDSGASPPTAIVIGSGFGGLAAAVRLGARGYRVTVLEKLDKPGGRAYVYEQDGFRFDAGPTIVTAPFLLEELWQLCGKRLSDDVELVPIDPFYRIRFDDGSVFDYSGDIDRASAEVAKFCPEDVEGFHRFLAQSKAVYDVGFTQLVDIPFHDWRTMVRIMPALIRLKSYRTVYGLVSKFFKDERLRT
ncbi:MAG: NAD(P)-binding protein, partial [Burkholderiales bacterium]